MAGERSRSGNMVSPLRTLHRKIRDRLMQYVQADPETGCWNWVGALTQSGYGQAWVGGRKCVASRIMYELANEPIPEGVVLYVCHRCDNPRCVNPDHLFLGDHAANMADAKAKGRMQRGEARAMSRLTESQVIAIRQKIAEGAQSLRSIAREFGVSHETIRKVRTGWRHVAAREG